MNTEELELELEPLTEDMFEEPTSLDYSQFKYDFDDEQYLRIESPEDYEY